MKLTPEEEKKIDEIILVSEEEGPGWEGFINGGDVLVIAKILKRLHSESSDSAEISFTSVVGEVESDPVVSNVVEEPVDPPVESSGKGPARKKRTAKKSRRRSAKDDKKEDDLKAAEDLVNALNQESEGDVSPKDSAVVETETPVISDESAPENQEAS